MRLISRSDPASVRTFFSASELRAVGQPANSAAWFSVTFLARLSCAGWRFASDLVGVGHPVEPLADVWGADARSAQICRPDGVARCFQVSLYKVEPRKAVRACNLLSKDLCRAALLDEVVDVRP